MAKKTVKDIMFNALVNAELSATQIMGHVERAHAFTELAKACAAVIQCRDLLPPEVVQSIETEIEPKTVEDKKEVSSESKADVQTKVSGQPKVKEEKPAEEEKSVASKKKSPVPEIKIEVPKTTQEKKEEEPEKKAPVLTEKWTDEAKEYLKQEMATFSNYIKQVKSEQGDQALRDMISAATDGHAQTPKEITPLNLKLVVDYISSILNSKEKE